MADGRNKTGEIAEIQAAAKARKAEEFARSLAQQEATSRRVRLQDAQFVLKGFEPFDRPPGFWNRFVDPIMELGGALREMDAARYLETVATYGQAESFRYGLEILRSAAGDDRRGVVELVAPLADGLLDSAFTSGVEFTLRDLVMEHVVREDYVATLGPYAPEPYVAAPVPGEALEEPPEAQVEGETGGDGLPEVTHSPDFRSVRWFGETYSFTERQAPMVKVLFNAWKLGVPDVGKETLLRAIDHAFPPSRLDNQFRGNSAWKSLIVPGATRGTYCFREPQAD